MPKFPDADGALDAWLAARPDKPLHLTLALQRSWETPAGSVRLDPRYRLGARGTALLAAGPGWALDLSRPVRLQPVSVDKPWGREVWYTAMEARGESRVQSADGVTLGLASYLALAPRRLCGGRTPILAKRLEPAPEPQLGNLYLETHDSKEELYVVTGLHARAWPGGVGRLRLGMDPQRRQAAGSDAALRGGFLRAVEAYGRARDEARDPVAGASTAVAELREHMLSFLDAVDVREGSVVHVPRAVPHRLAHGIEVLELQTPSYERRIIAFDQPLRTQRHWDSAAAIESLSLATPAPADVIALDAAATGRCRGALEVERLPDVAGCRVMRTRLDRGAAWCPTASGYQLMVLLAGRVRLDGLELTAGDAAWLPTAECLAADAGWVEALDCDTLLLHATPG